jgi:acyl-CoA thioester hydrolase
MSTRGYTLVHEIQPRFRDTDAMGHINNAVYITYLEVARIAYWRALEATREYGQGPFILARIAADFRSEARVDETLLVGIRCEWIGTKSFALSYEIREKSTGRLVVEADSVLVCYDYVRRQSIPMPEALRRRIEAFDGRRLDREGGTRS